MMIEPCMKTEPYAHQLECFRLSRDREVFADLSEQGLGKTKVALDVAAHLYLNGKIDALFVVAPNGVHANWIRREVPTHLSERTNYRALSWRSQAQATRKFGDAYQALVNHDGLAVFAMNVEALSGGGPKSPAVTTAKGFLDRRCCLMVVDESSRIKTPGSNRTKRVINLGKHAAYRRIATGTPVTQSPFDLYAQFRFLDPEILGFGSYYAFKHHYGVFERERASREGKTWAYDKLVRYVRLDELRSTVAPHSFRRTKDECLDLPAKIYKRIPVTLTPLQRRMYEQVEVEGELKIPEEGFHLLARAQITRLLRCQQIVGGFVPTGIPDENNVIASWIDGPNPKLNMLMEMTSEDHVGKTIVWARFRPEIAMIAAALRKEHGRRAVVELHGGVTGKDRDEAVDRFQDSEGARFLVGQQQSGIGITLTAAEYVFYFSNTFSYEQRFQSEDRAHRIGTKHSVVYVDLEADDTVDERIRDVLFRCKEAADDITGDKERKEKE